MSFSPTNNNKVTYDPALYEVRFAPGIYERMCASVGALEPEHYALLGGYLNDPLRVTDFAPMPPMLDHAGRYRMSAATVTLNGPFIEYYLNTSLLPFGKYILGVMHSHPGDMTSLSGGTAGSGYGDIPSMRGHLEAAARFGEPWHNFIAPIVTRPGPAPRVTSWIVRLDTPAPIRASTVWEAAPVPLTPMPVADTSVPADDDLDDLLDLVRYRPELVAAILRRGARMNAYLPSRRARDEYRTRILLGRLMADRKKG